MLFQIILLNKILQLKEMIKKNDKNRQEFAACKSHL